MKKLLTDTAMYTAGMVMVFTVTCVAPALLLATACHYLQVTVNALASRH